MKNNKLLIIVLVFIIGYTTGNIIQNICDVKLVEGFSFANWFLPYPRAITGADGKQMPSNATGCYGDNCKTPLTKSVDEHVNKTISRFNSCNTDQVNAFSKTMNEYDVHCFPPSEEEQIRNDELQANLNSKAMETGHKGMMCAAPVYCSNNVEADYKQDATSIQTVTINNVATYSPVNNLSDNTNIADVVSQQTKFKDSSITGNSDGPHNSQTLAEIELKGRDISDQAATFINLVNLNASQNTENKIVQTGTPVYTYQFWKDDEDVDNSTACGKINLNQHTVANQTISVASSVSNNAQLDDKHKQGITVDADNKQETEHDNTNLNKIADTAADAWDHTVDDVAGTLQNEMNDLTTGALGAMILPFLGIGVLLLLCAVGYAAVSHFGGKDEAKDYMNKAADGIGQVGQFGMDSARGVGQFAAESTRGVGQFAAESARGVGSTLTGAVRGITSRFLKDSSPQSGGGLKTLSNTLDNIKLSNEQLIMIITIILLLYNIYK